ncbi:MAG TPA: formylglycine-generating enzyme family protein [candidate division Zixibacteria bacterium]|nr:formylglycine-generating enzyme family protein [candidate division Zixibacteria bacterium]
MVTTVRQQRDKANKSWPMRGEGALYPIYYTSWEEAVAFCEELSRMTGEAYRLPSEAEWEYACRAGAPAKYYWGDSNSESVMKQYAWYEKNAYDGDWTSPHAAREGTQPVGQKLSNAWGLYDMAGNVWEWCSDWHSENYSNSPSKDPRGPSSGLYRVLRGGSWGLGPWYLRSSARLNLSPVSRYNLIGFRILRDVK